MSISVTNFAHYFLLFIIDLHIFLYNDIHSLFLYKCYACLFVCGSDRSANGQTMISAAPIEQCTLGNGYLVISICLEVQDFYTYPLDRHKIADV